MNGKERRKRGGQSKESVAFNVFISHAGPDKHTLAAKIHARLKKLGVWAFLDFKELRPGEQAPSSMVQAMEEAFIFVIIVSPEFAARKWTVRELMCALRRYDEAKAKGKKPPLIIPAFYRLDVEGCKPKNFMSTDEWAVLFRREGTLDRMKGEGYSMEQISDAMGRLPEFTGIENKEGASNEEYDEEKRERYAQEIVEAIMSFKCSGQVII